MELDRKSSKRACSAEDALLAEHSNLVDADSSFTHANTNNNPYADDYADYGLFSAGDHTSEKNAATAGAAKRRKAASDNNIGANDLRAADSWQHMAYLREKRKQNASSTLIQDADALARLEIVCSAVQRPKPPDDYLHSSSGGAAADTLDVYMLDIDYCTAFWSESPVVRIFGLTLEGYTVALFVGGFYPYFYVRINAKLREDLESVISGGMARFRSWLDCAAAERDKKGTSKDGAYVRDLQVVKRRSIYGYEPGETEFLRIETFQPKHVPLVRDVLFGKESKSAERRDAADSDDESNEQPPRLRPGRYGAFEVFEADIPFTLNFCVERGLYGCGWFSVNKKALQLRRRLETNTHFEFQCRADDVCSLRQRSEVPPLRTIAIDIECANRPKHFPEPTLDPVICLSANVYRLQDGMRPMASVGFGVGEIAPSAVKKDFITICFGGKEPVIDPKTGEWNAKAETEMLLAFARFVLASDPDFLSGWNSDGFDFPYLFKRADHLGIGHVFRALSRLSDELCSLKKHTFSSKAFGTHTDLDLKCPGRVDWDVLRVTRREVKSRSYTLNYQANDILGKKKHEISHDQIGPSWLGPDATPLTRRRVLDYNEHDERLAYEINAKKLFVYSYQELARATGVTVAEILTRGQGVKTLSQIMRVARAEGYVIPTFATIVQKCERSGFFDVLANLGIKRSSAGAMDDDDDGSDDEDEAEGGGDDGDEDVVTTPFGTAKLADRFPPLSDATLNAFNPRKDMMFYVHILQNHGSDALVSRTRFRLPQGGAEAQLWTSNEENNDKFMAAYRYARASGASVWLAFTEYAGENATHRPFYGLARITSDMLPGTNRLPKWKSETWNRNNCFSIEWICQLPVVQSSDQGGRSLPRWFGTVRDAVELKPENAYALLELCDGREPQQPPKAKGKKKGKGSKDVNDEIAYKGAIVIPTILGFYGVPISTLDFSGLYPSIMIFNNLCWTTYTTQQQVEQLGLKERPKDTATGKYILTVYDKDGNYVPENDGDYIITPAGHYFVTPKIRSGLMTRILISLIECRGKAKNVLGKVKSTKKAIGELRGVASEFSEAELAYNRSRLLKSLLDPEAADYTTSESKKRNGVKPSKEEIDAEAKKRVREKHGVDVAATHDATLLGIVRAVLEKAARKALDDLDKAVLVNEPTSMPLFRPLRAKFDAMPPTAGDARFRVLDELYGEYENLECVYEAKQNALKVSANSCYG